MGWRDRDYAKWTEEERERFLGPGASNQDLFGGQGGLARASGLLRPGAALAILVTGALLLAQFPSRHPILSPLHISLPGSHPVSSGTPSAPTGKISGPSTAAPGSTLTLHGTAPLGNGPVTIEGSYDGGQTWQTLSRVTSANGSYTAQVALSHRGFLQIRIVFADGSQAVGSVNVD